MKIEKDKRQVNIVCEDGSLIKGFVHINPGERMIDFINDTKEVFIAVTEVEFYNIKEIHSFKLFSEMTKNKKAIVVNKTSIKLIEEL